MDTMHLWPALQSLAVLFQCSEDDVLQCLEEAEVAAASARLTVQNVSWLEQLGRTTLSPILERLPQSLRLRLTNVLKALRNRTGALPALDPEGLSGNQLVQQLAQTYACQLYGGKQYCISLAHDVDGVIGYDFIPSFVEELKARQLTSSFYFLTHSDYRVESDLLAALASDGFEVALHGATHDLGIAYRKPTYIRDWLARALDTLAYDVQGFRSPGLSLSPTILTELERAGFLYDSSMQYGASLYHSTAYAYPFYLAPQGLVEVPIWFQDAFLFRDATLSTREALDWCRTIIPRLKAQHATVVFLMHPDNMVTRQDFFRTMLDFVAEESDALVCPLLDLVHRFQALNASLKGGISA